MWSEPRQPVWSKYALGEAEMAALTPQIVQAAARLGFDLHAEALEVAHLQHSDAIAARFDNSTRAAFYLEYPMLNRERDGDPVTLRPMTVGRMLEGMHERRWKREHHLATRACPDNEARQQHLDCDAPGRWAAALAASGGVQWINVIVGTQPHEAKVSATVKTAAGTLHVSDEGLWIPGRLPETIASSLPGRPLGALASLPRCGDDALDRELAQTTIRSAEAVNRNARQGTLVTLGHSFSRPVRPGAENAEWRRIRSVRPLVQTMAPDYVEIDWDRTAVEYRQACAKAGVPHDEPVRM